MVLSVARSDTGSISTLPYWSHACALRWTAVTGRPPPPDPRGALGGGKQGWRLEGRGGHAATRGAHARGAVERVTESPKTQNQPGAVGEGGKAAREGGAVARHDVPVDL